MPREGGRVNVDISLEDGVNAAAALIAGAIYGGFSEDSDQWKRCVEAARALNSGIVPATTVGAAAWQYVRQSFDIARKFNAECPGNTEGVLQPEFGPAVFTKVEQGALVFPRARELCDVMAFFDNVGWQKIERFRKEAKQKTVAEELALISQQAKAQGKNDLCQALIEAALASDPTYWYGMNEMGVLMGAMHFHASAVCWYDKTIALKSDVGEVWNNRGISCRALGLVDQAVHDLTEARRLLPKNELVTVNLVSAMEDAGRIDDALALLDEAIARNPLDSNIHHNKALPLLSAGRFEEGWNEYAYRLLQPGVNAHYEHYPVPRWDGRELDDANVLVWTEQGLGDEIMIASMIPDLAKSCRHVTFLCQDRLVPLFRRSFPEVTVGERPTTSIVDLFRREPLRPEVMPRELINNISITCQMSQGDLGKKFRNSFEDFPDQGALFKCDKQRRDAYWNALAEDGKQLVGISWHSKKNPLIGDLKGVDLIKWRDILTTPGVKFVNLQYGDTSEIDEVAKSFGVKIARVPDLNFERDLDGFASLVAAMDMVISTSNTTVHFAGALNVPCWVMTPHGPGKLWYFFQGRDKMPWYSSVRLYRQKAASQWEEVIAAIAEDFKEWITCSL